ncbi:tRNA pseudouridine synthase [Martensiomyces pterosporus]|nr:tRNA pseudouridine synthase [Martensiomyces pterosporus]
MDSQQPVDYESWTKEALIERLRSLDRQAEDSAAQTPDGSAPETPRKRKKKPVKFDFARFPQRKVAFKFSYFGWSYHGLARQGNALASDEKRQIEEQFPTVEGEVFKALAKCKLITNESECDYTRCGRTDRGVSGFGQVISLYVRSAGRPVLLPAPEKEFPYINMLNKTLPPGIRMLAWSPVKPDFSARFSCRSRFYRYFFTEEGLDINAMKDAASRYAGTHDFRNFCRLDPAKQITNFERQVFSIGISPVPSCVPFLELRGTAFLWHQVRCMMAILLLVGQGLEKPDIVDKLLDIGQTPGKPEYEMAADTPLVLADCAYDEADVQWIHVRSPGQDMGNMVVLDRVISQQWGMLNTQAVLASALLENLRSTCIPTSNEPSTSDDAQRSLEKWADCRASRMSRELQGGARFILGGGKIKYVRKYVPLLQRKQAESAESRNKAWMERKGNKRAKNE